MNEQQRAMVIESVNRFFNGDDLVWVTPGTDNHSANFYGVDHIIPLERDDVVGCIEIAYENWNGFLDENGDEASGDARLEMAIDAILDDLQGYCPEGDDDD